MISILLCCCHNALLCFSSSLEWVSDFISSLLHGNLFKLKLHQQHWSLFIHYSMAKQMSHYAEICLPRKKKVWESFQWVFVQMCPALLNNLITDLQFRMFNCLYLLYLQFKHLQDLWWDVTRASRSGLGLSEPYKSCKRPARVWEPQRPTSSQNARFIRTNVRFLNEPIAHHEDQTYRHRTGANAIYNRHINGDKIRLGEIRESWESSYTTNSLYVCQSNCLICLHVRYVIELLNLTII